MRSSRWIRVLILLSLLAGCGGTGHWAFGDDAVDIPPIAVSGARMPSGPIPAVFMLPPGKGPFPAVIILHGCGGRGPSQITWATRLNLWGYAALIPDSLTPRDVRRVCEPEAQSLVTPRDRVGDVGSAIAWLWTRPEIAPGRIAVLGQSHGGAAATMATQRLYEGFGLRAAINYYGPCINPAAHGTVPLLVLAGEADDWGNPALRCRTYATAARADEPIDVRTYPGVHHAFDNPEMVGAISNAHLLLYNQAAAEDSFIRVHDFLDRWMKH